MSNYLELEEVASDCIEVEVDTSDIVLLEPLRDHNYILKHQNETSNSETPQIIKLNTRRTLNKLPKITKLSALYNCRICGFMTMKQECIVAHREIHKKIEPRAKYRCTVKTTPVINHKCPKCSYVAKTKSSLKLHMNIHTKGEPYKCKECGYAGKELKDLVNHYKAAENMFCHVCSYSSHWKEQFVEHVNTHVVIPIDVTNNSQLTNV